MVPARLTDQPGAKHTGAGVAETGNAAIRTDGPDGYHSGIVRVAIIGGAPVAATIVAGHPHHDHAFSTAAIFDRLIDCHRLDRRHIQLLNRA